MIDVQKIIDVVKNVFGNVRLPLRLSIMDNEGLELYSTTAPSEMGVDSVDVLGILAFEELTKSVSSRGSEIDTLIFRTKMHEYFIAPIAQGIFLSAVANIGKIAPLQVLLDGLRIQITAALNEVV